jgi:heme/copper-type cytochrome/quinol oxidase subunit 1
MRAAIARWSVLIIGLVAIVIGIVLVAQRQSSFGWFAYAPLTDLSFMPVSSLNIAGLLVLAVGLVLVAGWVGFMIARRRSD